MRARAMLWAGVVTSIIMAWTAAVRADEMVATRLNTVEQFTAETQTYYDLKVILQENQKIVVVNATSGPGDAQVTPVKGPAAGPGTAAIASVTHSGGDAEYIVWGTWGGGVPGSGPGSTGGEVNYWVNEYLVGGAQGPHILLEVNEPGEDDDYVMYGSPGATVTVLLVNGTAGATYDVTLTGYQSGLPGVIGVPSVPRLRGLGAIWKGPLSGVQVGNTEFGATVSTSPTTAPPASAPASKPVPVVVKITSLAVTGARQTNVIPAKDPNPERWAEVKGAGDVTVTAVTLPVNPDEGPDIHWTVNGQPVQGQRECKVSKGASNKFTVTAKSGNSEKTVDIWVIWVDVDIDTDKNHNLDPILKGKIPALLTRLGAWNEMMGRGTSLGSTDSFSNNRLTYARAIGKMQATGTIKPAGAEFVISKNAWGWIRTVNFLSYDNGGHYENDIWKDGPSSPGIADFPDGPDPRFSVLDPTITGGKIFNLDTPACSVVLGFDIKHNSELYANFDQYATVNLGGQDPLRCSDIKLWRYWVRVNLDLLPANPVLMNDVEKVANAHTPLPNGPHFTRK